MTVKNLYKELESSFHSDTGMYIKNNEALYIEYIKMKIAHDQVIYTVELFKKVELIERSLKEISSSLSK